MCQDSEIRERPRALSDQVLGGEKQIVESYAAREPAASAQRKRAKVGSLFSNWFKAASGRVGIPALPARPWDTLVSSVPNASAG